MSDKPPISGDGYNLGYLQGLVEGIARSVGEIKVEVAQNQADIKRLHSRLDVMDGSRTTWKWIAGGGGGAGLVAFLSGLWDKLTG